MYHLKVELGSLDGYDRVSTHISLEDARYAWEHEWQPLPATITDTYGTVVEVIQTRKQFLDEECFRYHDEDCYCRMIASGASDKPTS